MARGYLYCVTSDPKNRQMTDASTAAMMIGGREAEWFDDISDEDIIKDMIKILHGKYKRLSRKDTVYEVVFPERCGIDYFRDKFNRVKKLIDSLTLEEFATKSQWDLSNAINERWGDAIYDESGYAKTFDEWVREICPGEKYYIYNAILMH